MKCKICSKILVGRSDKLFCSLRCKNYYHTNLRKATKIAVKRDRYHFASKLEYIIRTHGQKEGAN
jgi:hypothetical protein